MSAWTAPAETLVAAGVTGTSTPVAGTVINYERVMNSHAWQVTQEVTSGSGYVFSLQFFGSLDGENWYGISGNAVTVTQGTIIAVFSDVPAQYVQAITGPFDAENVALTVSVAVVAREVV